MKQTNWNELRDRAYKIANEHGFHEGTESTETALMLVITELSEAVNADRKNHHANVDEFKKYTFISDFGFISVFERCIKDSISDELADTIIRLLDLAGANEIDLKDAHCSYNYAKEYFEHITFAAAAYEACSHVVYDSEHIELELDDIIIYAISYIIDWCQYLNIDILWHIEQKMRYNELCEYKHGKEY